MKLIRRFKYLFIIFVLYVLWSVYIYLAKPIEITGEDALVRCFFLLTPLGILGIGVVIAKIVQAMIAIRVIKYIKNLIKKHWKEKGQLH